MFFLAAAAIGTGISALGQHRAGKDANKAAKINAKNKEKQAKATETQTAANVGAQRRGFDKFRAALRADLAAYGGSAKRGTGLLMAQEAERTAKLDELNIITQGANDAWALRTNAEMDRREGRSAQRNATMGALGTAISGFGQIGMQAAGMQ